MKLREWGIAIGALPTGPHNAITDVEEVRVGQAEVIHGSGKLVPGEGPARTGVTALWPASGNLFEDKVPAGAEILNGFTKCIGITQIIELGHIETPILITNTLNVGKCADSVIEYLFRRKQWDFRSINSVVTECNDAYLSDVLGRHVQKEHVFAALDSATDGPVAEGKAGAGVGMSCYGLSGGIGTASRVVELSDGAHTVGTLVCTNMGSLAQLRVDGVRIGRELSLDTGPSRRVDGSVIILVATDASLDPVQLRRFSRRAFHGLARTGTITDHGSGDVCIAWTTSYRIEGERTGKQLPQVIPRLPDRDLKLLFEAVAESTEESVLNSMWQAETITGRDGNTRFAIPLDQVREAMGKRGYTFSGS